MPGLRLVSFRWAGGLLRASRYLSILAPRCSRQTRCVIMAHQDDWQLVMEMWSRTHEAGRFGPPSYI